ncbi:MAG TPA: ABC transporter permease subunit [Solirubrobacterales bacterium]
MGSAQVAEPTSGARKGATQRWSVDQRTEIVLGVLSAGLLVLIGFMIVFVFSKAWPSFANNGLAWFGPGGDVDTQLAEIFNSPAESKSYNYTIHVWPMLWSTMLITGGAVILATFISVLSAMFIVEFAPAPVRAVLQPAIRLLAAVPSVIYGLIGLLVIVPFVGNHVITTHQKESVQYVIQLGGSSLIVGIVVLTVMITPIMVAIITDALHSVPRTWTEGAKALGVNRWRALRTVGVRAARPAIVAAAVLATARALGEAIMLSMVAGSSAFAPNPLDGLVFFYEPARTIAATIVDNADGLSVKPFGQTLYAFAAVLLISSAFLSFAGWAARQAMSKYTLGAR